MKITAIIVLYKTPEKEVKRLSKELNKFLPTVRIITIDNTRINRGFARAVNLRIKKLLASTDVFLILNPDIHITKLSNETVLQATKRFDVAGGVFTQDSVPYYGGVIDYWTRSGGLSTKNTGKQFEECDFVSGSLMLITKNCIQKNGFLNEDYFMYYEDVEYCYRAKKNGLKVGITTTIAYEHFETSHDNPEKEFYLTRNRLLFLYQNGTLLQKLRQTMLMPIHYIQTYFPDTAANNYKRQVYTTLITSVFT